MPRHRLRHGDPFRTWREAQQKEAWNWDPLSFGALVQQDPPPGAAWCCTSDQHLRLYCPTCVQSCSSIEQWKLHRTGRGHWVRSGVALAWANKVGWHPDPKSETPPGSKNYLTWILRHDEIWPKDSEMWFKDDLHHQAWDPRAQTWKKVGEPGGPEIPHPLSLRNLLRTIRTWLEEDSGKVWMPFYVLKGKSGQSELRVRRLHDVQTSVVQGQQRFQPERTPPPTWITWEDWATLRQSERGRIPGDPQPFRLHVLTSKRKAQFYCETCGAFANSLIQWVGHRNSPTHRVTVLKCLYLDHLKNHLMVSCRRAAAKLMPRIDTAWPEELVKSVANHPDLDVLQIVTDDMGCEVIEGKPSDKPFDRHQQQAILKSIEDSLSVRYRGEHREKRIVPCDSYSDTDGDNWPSQATATWGSGPLFTGKVATDVPDVPDIPYAQTQCNHGYNCYDYLHPDPGAGSSYPSTSWLPGPGAMSAISK